MGCLLEVLANCGNIYSQSTDSSNKRKTETTRKHHLTQGNDKRLYALAIFTTLQHWTIWQICQCVSELSQLAIWNQSTSYIRLQCQRYTCRTTSLENGSLLCQWWRTKCFLWFTEAGRNRTREKGDWKFITMEPGELSATTVWMTLQRRLLATDSDSGKLWYWDLRL